MLEPYLENSAEESGKEVELDVDSDFEKELDLLDSEIDAVLLAASSDLELDEELLQELHAAKVKAEEAEKEEQLSLPIAEELVEEDSQARAPETSFEALDTDNLETISFDDDDLVGLELDEDLLEGPVENSIEDSRLDIPIASEQSISDAFDSEEIEVVSVATHPTVELEIPRAALTPKVNNIAIPLDQEEQYQEEESQEEAVQQEEGSNTARVDRELTAIKSLIEQYPSLDFLRPRVAALDVDSTELSEVMGIYRMVCKTLQEQEEEYRSKTEVLADQKRHIESQLRAKSDELKIYKEMSSLGVGAPAAEVSRVNDSVGSESDSRELSIKLEAAEEQRKKLLQDFENQRSRHKIDMEIQVFQAKASFFKDFLQVLDNFEKAVEAINSPSPDMETISEGILMVYEQMGNTLEEAGLKPVEALGEPFDPHVHEGVGEDFDSNYPEEHVSSVLQKGYYLGEKLLRPALVKVARD